MDDLIEIKARAKEYTDYLEKVEELSKINLKREDLRKCLDTLEGIDYDLHVKKNKISNMLTEMKLGLCIKVDEEGTDGGV